MNEDIQYLSGFQPVLQALIHRRRPLFSLLVSRQKDSEELVMCAEDAGVQTMTATSEKIGQLAGTSKHQGVVLECGPLPTFTLEDLLRFEAAHGKDLLVLLAGVDPRISLEGDSALEPHGLPFFSRSSREPSRGDRQISTRRLPSAFRGWIRGRGRGGGW
jgi:hypothetical protein